MRKLAWGLTGLAVVLACLLLLPISETKVQIGRKVYSYSLSPLVKAAAFREREVVYGFFVDEVIAPGIMDREEKARRIFDWINDRIADPPSAIREPMERHELDFLLRKYGSPLERMRIFRNLLEFAHCQSRAVGTHLAYNDAVAGRWVVVARVAEGQDLYFDMGNRLFLTTPEGRVATVVDIKDRPRLVSTPPGASVEIDHRIFDASAQRLELEDIDLPERPSLQRSWGRIKSLFFGGF